jgi:hypothetical protein
MDSRDLQIAEEIFKNVRKHKIYNKSDLTDKVKLFIKDNSLGESGEINHLYSYLEEMRIIRVVDFGNKVHLYLTMEGEKFSSVKKALDYFDVVNSKKERMIDLEIERANRDIWWSSWGKLFSLLVALIGIILGAIANQYDWFGLFQF